MKRHAPLIALVVGTIGGNQQAVAAVSELIGSLRGNGGAPGEFAESVERIIAGERDAEVLCTNLASNSSMIIETILQALENPSVLESLIPKDQDDAAE